MKNYKNMPIPPAIQKATTAWKPTPEQMEALMLSIEGKAPAPTSYLSRRLEDLYEGLANTYGVECDLHNEDKPEVGSSMRDETGRKKKISPSTLFRILLAFAKYNIIAVICAFCSVLLYENLTWEFTYPLALFSALAVDFLFHKYSQEE